MKIILRILAWPFAIATWIIYFSYKWLRYGGNTHINMGKNDFNPVELLEEIKKLNEKLSNNDTKIK